MYLGKLQGIKSNPIHANIITETYIYIMGYCWHAYLAKSLQDFLHFNGLISHLWGYMHP